MKKQFLQCLALLGLFHSGAWAQQDEATDGRTAGLAPDLRDAELPATAKKGNFVAVPIPFSNPTLGSGLVGAVAYFHPQTEQQARTQPASMTGFGAMYSSTESYGLALGHAGYWKEDTWRFKGAVADADVELPLLSADGLRLDWNVMGSFLYSEIARRVADNWYLGISGRWVDVDQTFSLTIGPNEFSLLDSFGTVGMGLGLSFDTRDMQTNAYDGSYFKVAYLSNSESLGGDLSYDTLSVAFRQYHPVTSSLVIAWELVGCDRSDNAPLWDACTLGLRGFPATDYMARSSLYGQVEARWKMAERWGMVGFAGSGQIDNTFSGRRENETIPSYGIGLRFMVDTSKRINMRLDYGQSNDTDAYYLSVMEAF